MRARREARPGLWTNRRCLLAGFVMAAAGAHPPLAPSKGGKIGVAFGAGKLRIRILLAFTSPASASRGFTRARLGGRLGLPGFTRARPGVRLALPKLRNGIQDCKCSRTLLS